MRVLVVEDERKIAGLHPQRAKDGLNKSVDCSSTHRTLSRADGLFRVSLVLAQS